MEDSVSTDGDGRWLGDDASLLYLLCTLFLLLHQLHHRLRQALDHGGWGPLIDLPCWCHCSSREVHLCWGDLSYRFHFKDVRAAFSLWPGSRATWSFARRSSWAASVAAGATGRLLFGYDSFGTCVWQEELPRKRGILFQGRI